MVVVLAKETHLAEVDSQGVSVIIVSVHNVKPAGNLQSVSDVVPLAMY
jgi:hypothetical protein